MATFVARRVLLNRATRDGLVGGSVLGYTNTFLNMIQARLND